MLTVVCLLSPSVLLVTDLRVGTDVHLDHVATDGDGDEGQGRGVVEPHCPVPFVKLNTDILEAESLNLLAEATVVDTLLTGIACRFVYTKFRGLLSIAHSFSSSYGVFCRFCPRRSSTPYLLLRLTRLVYTVGCFLTFLFEL